MSYTTPIKQIQHMDYLFALIYIYKSFCINVFVCTHLCITCVSFVTPLYDLDCSLYLRSTISSIEKLWG